MKNKKKYEKSKTPFYKKVFKNTILKVVDI